MHALGGCTASSCDAFVDQVGTAAKKHLLTLPHPAASTASLSPKRDESMITGIGLTTEGHMLQNPGLGLGPTVWPSKIDGGH